MPRSRPPFSIDPSSHTPIGTVFTITHSEGYPGRRYYGGQKFTEKVEHPARKPFHRPRSHENPGGHFIVNR
ncbi:hypothetical protein G3N56_14140 [Desulfovibrio sulfodismutans]|uniref:Serine hydroxymethyltransferase-like domain-containing protein n=1 Tax=Desulfolutivibrio sulfodismutans TaxID=63561 RepID=A0A7K3NNU9_9BACT|nr:hypothetical protein [Desulfolutivibrio sulfodismutans]QLA14415.1 hypothetical protein GD606_05710 [Desulfolutivibrio sulfodismutans DSM 3696]